MTTILYPNTQTANNNNNNNSNSTQKFSSTNFLRKSKEIIYSQNPLLRKHEFRINNQFERKPNSNASKLIFCHHLGVNKWSEANTPKRSNIFSFISKEERNRINSERKEKNEIRCSSVEKYMTSTNMKNILKNEKSTRKVEKNPLKLNNTLTDFDNYQNASLTIKSKKSFPHILYENRTMFT